ncbi:MAG: hypothetical protein HQM04_13780 [Magnetococcales bacterium]|nr:hypothetical protein [Magnetococcales bacterium]MBF0116093.1 hypothetical protein [Magnetococcales bacterium]
MKDATDSITIVDLQDGSEEGMRLVREQMQAGHTELCLVNVYDCADHRRSLGGLLQDIERGGLVAAVRSASQDGDSVLWGRLLEGVWQHFSQWWVGGKQSMAKMLSSLQGLPTLHQTVMGWWKCHFPGF